MHSSLCTDILATSGRQTDYLYISFKWKFIELSSNLMKCQKRLRCAWDCVVWGDVGNCIWFGEWGKKYCWELRLERAEWVVDSVLWALIMRDSGNVCCNSPYWASSHLIRWPFCLVHLKCSGGSKVMQLHKYWFISLSLREITSLVPVENTTLLVLLFKYSKQGTEWVVSIFLQACWAV